MSSVSGACCGGPGMTPDVKPNLIELASIYLEPSYNRYPYHRGGCYTMLWDQTKQLPKELLKQVEEIYRDNFPLEVRLHLASWIEENFSPKVPFNANDPAHQKTAVDLANQLIAHLNAKIAEMPNDPDKFLLKGKLGEIAEQLKQSYSANPLALYVAVRRCLEQEMKIVEQAPTAGGSSGEFVSLVRQAIAQQKQQVMQTAVELEHVKNEVESFSVEFYNLQEENLRLEAAVQTHGEQHPEVRKYKAKLDAKAREIKQKYLNLATRRQTLITSYKDICQRVKEVQVRVLDTILVEWKTEQQLSGNGRTITSNLDTLQEMCEGLADIIWTMRQQVKQLQDINSRMREDDPHMASAVISELLSEFTELLSNLVSGTFVIEKQPPQVMKTNTRFTSTVRLLVGGVLNVHMAAPQVTVSIVSEQQAIQLISAATRGSHNKDDYKSGDILNGNGTMEFHQATKQVSVTFRNLQLKKIKRAERKQATESVMDEKFAVLFWSEFQVADLRFQIWSLSLPVVVIVHGNQEPAALATVTWDNAFAQWGRAPFVVPDKVTWAQAGDALNMKWKAACGRDLSEENLYYLACKAFRNNNLPRNRDEYNKLMLTWSLFCKENLPDRTFTFWEWFYRVLILTSNHLQRLWKEGHVTGFVSKEAANSMLVSTQKIGCFLLRFSEGELGGVTIAYVKGDMYAPGGMSVQMVSPFTTKDLSQRSMVDVFFDLGDLTTLYPNTNKEELRKFCSAAAPGQSAQSANGYVRHTLVTHVEGVSSGMDSNPATPAGGYDVMHAGFGSQADAMSPGQFPMDEEFGDQSFPNVDINNPVDVATFLGDLSNVDLNNLMPGNPSNPPNF